MSMVSLNRCEGWQYNIDMVFENIQYRLD